MSFLEVHKKFRKIEDDFVLFNKKIYGFFFWDYLRFPAWYKILEKTGTTRTSHRQQKLNTLGKIRRRILKRRNAIFHTPCREKTCEYLFIGHPRRKLGTDGRYWDLYSDPIIEVLGPEKCLLLEEPYQGVHYRPPKTKRVVYTDVFDYSLGFIKKEAIDLIDSEITYLKQIEKSFEYHFDLQDIGLLKLFEQILGRRQFVKKFFSQLLLKLQPKIVFLICSYFKEAYIETCQEQNITTIELQHGVMTPYHPGYEYPTIDSKKTFPDFFFSFGAFWQESVSMPLALDSIFQIGYPYFELEKSAYTNCKKKKKVLFISQGIVGHELSSFAVQLFEFLPDAWEVIYKLHPGEVNDWKKEYPWLLNREIKVVEGNTPPLYNLMAEADIQIGVSSTALFEGLSFGCQTYIVDLPGHEYMESLIQSGTVQCVHEPQEVQFGNFSQPLWPKEYFFAENWQQNLIQALDTIKDITQV